MSSPLLERMLQVARPPQLEITNTLHLHLFRRIDHLNNNNRGSSASIGPKVKTNTIAERVTVASFGKHNTKKIVEKEKSLKKIP